jgi:redox-sensitive bicupin YhaK (pirin superfamily)
MLSYLPLIVLAIVSCTLISNVVSLRIFSPISAVTRVSKTFVPVVQPSIKLPVWPVYGGVAAQICDWAGNSAFSEKIVDSIGGRVVPMSLGETDFSPFLLLVHHAHSFMPFDPIRPIQQLILPEGFPAHPHSGFSTVTYAIKGGLRHRDSEGNKMAYGNGDVQWMRAGRGTIHEEMWDIKNEEKKFTNIEIFQLWVNLPREKKTLPPKVVNMKNDDIPVITLACGSSVKLIAGTLHKNADDTALNTRDADEVLVNVENDAQCSIHRGPGNDFTSSPVGILHMQVPRSGTCRLIVPANSTVGAYIRRGSLLSEDGDMNYCTLVKYQLRQTVSDTNGSADADLASIDLRAGSDGADVLLLIGTASTRASYLTIHFANGIPLVMLPTV